MVIVLLALLLLAGLVAYVFNSGRQTARRVAMQNAADAAAAAGSGWVARSLNLVAMNNVAISRHLATVNVLDSAPTATHSANLEQTFLHDAMQQGRSWNTGSGRLDAVAYQNADLLLAELQAEVAMLDPVDQMFQANDVRRMTHYNAPDGRGRLWEAMQSLDELSQTTMENLAVLTQLNTTRGGQVADEEDARCLLLPAVADVPWQRRTFNDFKRPVKQGLLPQDVDDKTTNRGPYDTLFGWRDFQNEYSGGGDRQRISQGTQTGGIGRPFGGGPGDRSTGGGEPRTITRRTYRTFGTQSWALRRMSDFVYARRNNGGPDNLEESRFNTWLRQLAGTKLGYCWDRLSPRMFAIPRWDAAYPAVPANVQSPLPFSETAYFRLDIKSKYARTDGRFMTDDGTWAYSQFNRAQGTRGDSAFTINRPTGWWLPRYTVNINGQRVTQRMTQPTQLSLIEPRATTTQIGPKAWLYEYPYTVLYDYDIDLPPLLDADGNMVPQDAYFVQLVVFGGVNTNPIPAKVFEAAAERNAAARDSDRDAGAVGSAIADSSLTESVQNPYAGFNPSASSAPAPIDLNHTEVKTDEDSRRAYLTFLAVAQRKSSPSMWPSRFGGAERSVAMAQAEVFNNHSWDLWTQAWSSQLDVIEDYDAWVEVLRKDAPTLPTLTDMTDEQIEVLLTRLDAGKALAEPMLGH